ncbi:hypothetical protein [Micromonospora rosaria]|uniref:hypothetical protein n=1 Tax=Micromonospora rosaria TaxID=47874 RepID=UPI0014719140
MSREAVDLYRELAAGNQDAYLPSLAMSLCNVGAVAILVDEPSEPALAATVEGTALLRGLAAAEPGAFTGSLHVATATLTQLQAMLDGQPPGDETEAAEGPDTPTGT